MDERLKRVVQRGVNINFCVNLDLLGELTIRYTYSHMDTYDWNKVRRLHILGSKTDWKQGNTRGIGSLKRGCYIDATGEWVLLAGANTKNLPGYLACCTSDIECLFIGYSELDNLDVQSFNNLKELYLIGNKDLNKVTGLDSCARLITLDLYRARFDFVLDLTPFSSLERLDLGFFETTGVQLNAPLERLRSCNLTHANIRDMGFLKNCLNLEELRLSRNPIRRVPAEIRKMEHLRSLTLTKLTLDVLPTWLPELHLSIGQGNRYGINLQDTTIVSNSVEKELSFLNGSQETILSWFKEQDRANAGGTPLNEIKVVFLGDGGTGKSLTIARLMANNIGAMPKDFDSEATPGVAIEDRMLTLDDGRNVRVHFWDFGGQEILHSMHRIFLTERTLYVVMINARDQRQDNQSHYWLNNVSSFAPGCPVLLVLNQVDLYPNASVDERGLQSKHTNLKKIIRLSALRDNRATFNNVFTRPLLEEIALFQGLSEMVPYAKKAVLERIRDMEKDHIKGSDFIEICKSENISDQAEQLKLMRWLNEIGISFFCGTTPRLKDYMVLRPEWITNALYTIIWNNQAVVVNGMVNQDDIYNLLMPGDDASVKMVRRDLKYKPEDVSYILDISRKFRLSFSMNNNTYEFFPALCASNSLTVDEVFPTKAPLVEFQFKYEYLPDNVLHQLMVDMNRDLQFDQVWVKGAVFKHSYNDTSALVISDSNENTLTIYIQSTGTAHLAHTYLNTFRSALDVIHNGMGLAEPERLVAFQKNGRKEYFDCATLEGTQSCGIEVYFSKEFKQMIPIRDILNGTDIQVVAEREKLLNDLEEIFKTLQRNKDYHRTPSTKKPVNENKRNRALRDALRFKGYCISDETRTGAGASGKSDGSLDLQIFYEPNRVMTNIEAMNLSSAMDSQLEIWDGHLEKLLGRYDPTGLPMLFLVSYVTCTRNAYSGICDVYKEHIGETSVKDATIRPNTVTDVLLDHEQYGNLRIYKCNYDRGGTPVTVYHYFVGFTLEEPQEKHQK